MFGGGGLFGDLPTAKGKSSATSGATSTTSSEDGKKGDQQQKEQQHKDGDSAEKPDKNRTTNLFDFTATNNTTAPKSNAKKSLSLVGALGNAGTTMAFLPTALRKRNRNSTGSVVLASANGGGGSSISNAATGNVDTNAMLVNPKKAKTVPAGSATTTVINTQTLSVEDKSQDIIALQKSDRDLDREKQLKPDEPQSQISDDTMNNHDKNNTPSTAAAAPVSPSESEQQEREEMRLLHASVTDANRYDPMIPNDLLAYREQKKNQRRRDQLEKNARETLRLQQIMREKIEEERKKVEATGDIQKIVENRMKATMNMAENKGSGIRSGGIRTTEGPVTGVNPGGGMGRGRGRGRGVSNLPAWLVKKQQEENALGKQEKDKEQNNENDSAEGKTIPSSSPKTLVLLSNMIGPGEIDDELSEEVKEECEIQCGPVEYVKVLDADQTHKEVRVFVKFSNASHADKASKLFQGRSFAQRVISARLVDEMEMNR